MSSSLTVFTVEYGNSRDRSFAMTDLALKRGFAYQGILLHSTKEEAQSALDAEIEDGEDADEMAVVVLKINRNGDLYDEYGTMLHDTISAQNNQSKRDVRQHLQEYFLHEIAGRRAQNQNDDVAMGM